MNLLGILKKKYINTLRHSDVELRIRRQLNMTIDVRLIRLLKRLAAQLTVPRNILGEHVLEVGCYYLTRTLESEHNTKILQRHLINLHLLDSGVDDSEAILRMGEGGIISQLLFRIEPIITNCRAIQQSMVIAKKTGDFKNYDKYKKELLRSAVGLAQWMEEHRPDELTNETT